MHSALEKILKIKKTFHFISYLGYPFFILGFAYLILYFFSPALDYKFRYLSLALLFMGFVMSFASMSDIEYISEKERKKILKSGRKQFIRLIMGIGGFTFAVLLGLIIIFLAKDYSLGFAITAFGIGGLALQKFKLDTILGVLKGSNP